MSPASRLEQIGLVLKEGSPAASPLLKNSFRYFGVDGGSLPPSLGAAGA